MHFSSESRARAFLWLLYHYHEAPSPNPFDDEQSRRHPGLVPHLEPLSAEEASLENVDTPDEKAWGAKMSDQRRIFLANKDALMIEDDGLKSKGRSMKRGRGRGRGRMVKAREGSIRSVAGSSKATREPSPTESTASNAPEVRMEDQYEGTVSFLTGHLCFL